MKKLANKAVTESYCEVTRPNFQTRAPSIRQALLAPTCIFLTATTALPDTVVIDGQGLSGFFIDTPLGSTSTPLVIGGGSNPSSALSRYEGGSKTLTTSGSGSTVFTNFSTKGGNGSGGGAGLGGVFFVDQGAVLKLEDVIFSANAVRGGRGGSDPALRLGNQSLVVQPKSLEVIEVTQSLAAPVIYQDDGTYKFEYVDVSETGADLLKLGSPVTFDTLTGDPETTIRSVDTTAQNLTYGGNSVTVTGGLVNLNSAVAVSNADVINVVAYNANTGTDGFEITGTGSDEIDFTNASATQLQAVENVRSGSTIFIGEKRTTVTDVSYDANNDVSKLTVADNMSGSMGDLDVISINSFKMQQFALSDSTVSVKSGLTGFEDGMQLFDADGNALNVKITSVNADGTFVVDNPTNLNGVGAFKARKSPILASNEIEVSSGLIDRLYVGATVYFSDIDETRTVTSVNSGSIVLDSAIVGVSTLEQRVVDGDEIGIELRNVQSAKENKIVLQAGSLNLQSGMILQGAGLKDGTVISSVGAPDGDGFVELTLSENVTGTVTAIVAKSPLVKGGAMNSLVSAGSGSDGNNGRNKNMYSTYYNGGEGTEGTNGYDGGELSGGEGGDGGYGGNGSDGMPVNPQLVQELVEATSGVIEATMGLADAVFPDPVVGLAVPIPDPLQIASATFELGVASVDLGIKIYDTVQWGTNLSNGVAGMGGDGGEGGEGGGGDEFFGGGLGGAGGVGGQGALSFTDGGGGGDGGRGGNGGFGAGGGSGGAGGESGTTGAASGGNPGDGGFGGFAAGDGSNGDGRFGGGGSGFGGAIFVRETGTLEIAGNAHFQRNIALGGSSSNLGSGGDGAGAAIFMMKGSTVTLAPGIGNTITFDDDIADDSASTYEGAPYAEGAGADLIIHANGGLVELNVENTYSGNTILRGATLSAVLGEGVSDASRLVFDGGGSITTTGAGIDTTSAGTLTRNGVGTFLITEDFTDRRVGNNYGVKWSGSGGFAAAPLSDVSGLSIVLGEYLPGEGQTLTWGADGFFENNADEVLDQNGDSTTKVLTFGSEFSTGYVNFTNDVVIDGQSASVAVYDTGTAGNSSMSILSGDWTGAAGSSLKVGDAGSEFDGDLYMTGSNALAQVMVFGGKLSTYNPLDVSTPGTLFSSAADVVVHSGSELDLRGAEALNSVSVNNGGILYLHADFDANTVSNLGLLYVGETADLDAQTTLSNGGTLHQYSEITSAGNVINDGMWFLSADQTINVGSGLTGSGDFCLETFGNNVTTCNGESEAASAVTLTFNQEGNSTFDGRFVGLGTLDKRGAGDLELTKAQTFVGGLNINAGTISTSGAGTLADTLSVTVGPAGTNDVGVLDTIAQLDNDGTVNLRANLTTTAGMENDGAILVVGDRTLTAATITGSGSIKGNPADGADNLTLNQSGVSTFAGEISNLTDFHKSGAGALTLTGTNAYSGTGYIDAGTLIIGSSAAMDSGNDYEIASGAALEINAPGQTTAGTSIDVLSGGTLNIVTKLQLNAIDNKSSETVNSEADVQITSLHNDGVWNVLSSKTIENTTLTGTGGFVLQDASGNATTLDLTQTGNSTFDGEFSGAGNLDKKAAGSLTLTAAQSFSGSLNVTAGAVITQGSATFSDQLDVVVGSSGSLILGVADTLGTLQSSGTLTINQNQSVSSADVLGGVTTLNANLTTSAVSDTLNVRAPGALRVADGIAMDLGGGLSGDGSIALDDDAEITLGSGTISTFNGTISEAVASPDSTLTISGGGELRLARLDPAGTNKLVTIDKIDIQNGRLGLDGSQLLNDSITVNLAVNGDLELINAADGQARYEDIDTLTGSGEIYLNSNTLNIHDGGSFEGSFYGNGSVNVSDGAFTINNSLSSTDGGLQVSSDEGTTVAAGTTIDVKRVDVNANSRLNVSGAGGANQQSVVRSTDFVVHTTSTLHMGSESVYQAGHSSNSVVEANSIRVHGMFSGNGTLSGSSITVTEDESTGLAATLAPGNSPGVQIFDADQTTLGNGSTVEIEVLNKDLAAGTGYDQLVFTSGSALKIESGSTLAIKTLAGSNAANYNLGTTIQFADFDANKITGAFSTVSLDNATAVSAFAVNLATGSLVGLGGQSLDQTAVSSNQKAMLAAFEVDDTVGAKQYYGGTFVEDLTVAMPSGSGAEQTVYALASPEAYAGVLGGAELVTSGILPAWKSDYFPDGKSSLYFSNYSQDAWRSGKPSAGDTSFSTVSNLTTFGRVFHSDTAPVVLSFGLARSDVDSDYLDADANGFVYGAAMVFGHNGRFHSSVGFSQSNLKFEGTRQTNRGSVSFDNVNVQTSEVTVGSEYRRNFDGASLSLKAAAAAGVASSSAFNETSGQTNTLSAMRVTPKPYNYARLDFGARYSIPVAETNKLFIGIDGAVHTNTGMEVGGSYDNGQANFEVTSDGFVKSYTSVNVGYQHKLKGGAVIDLGFGTSNDVSSSSETKFSVGFRKSF